MANTSDDSSRERKTPETGEPDLAIQKDADEQETIPPGRYLTGVRLVLVCIRSVVLLLKSQAYL
jgi:hypothetical protein